MRFWFIFLDSSLLHIEKLFSWMHSHQNDESEESYYKDPGIVIISIRVPVFAVSIAHQGLKQNY